MKYQELIPETNILALIVHEIICSGLNHNNHLSKISNPGNSRYTHYLSVYRLQWQPCSLILTAPSVGKYSVYQMPHWRQTQPLLQSNRAIHQTSPTPREKAHRWRLSQSGGPRREESRVERFMGAANSFH